MVRDHGKTALIHRGRDISYSELIESIGSFANLLDTLPDERVLIISENRPEWVYTLYATWRRGSIAVPVDFMSTPEEVAYVIEDSKPKVALCSQQTEETLKKAVELAGVELEVINYDEVALPKPYEKVFHREIEDLALLLYTSGTTGKPKGVMLTFRNIFSNIEGIAETGIATREDSTLAILPFHHSYPLMVTVLVPIHIGATVVFLDKLTPEDIVDKLKRYRISIVVGVPRLYTLFHKRVMERIEANPVAKLLFKLMESLEVQPLRRKVFSKVHEAFGGNVKYFVSGGAKLDPEVAKDFTTLGFTVIEGYGLTETSPIVTFNPPDRIKLGSVGLPIKGVQVRLANDGEVLVKGPNVMKGYWNKPKETEDVLRNGWLYTGDLGEFDEEGYLYIKGRKKELIVLGTGKNVQPEEIENLFLRRTELIKEVGVLEREGKLYALIYPDLEKAKERRVVNLEETLKWEAIDPVNRELPDWKRIVGFRLSPVELPKTRLGKLKRFMLPELYERALERPKEKEDLSIFNTPEGDLIRNYLFRETRKEVLPSHHIELDLGLDSLGKVELLSFLENAFGVVITEEELSEHSTVRELIELVRSRKERIETKETNWEDILKRTPSYELPDHPFLFKIGRAVLKAFFKLYNRVEVEGTENLPEPPFILAPNHASYMDAFVLASVLPERVAKDTYFLGEETYFRNPVARLFGRLAHVITVDINRNLKESLQKVAHALREGKVVVIFPEGARTRDGGLMEFKKGVAILSKELKVPIVPVGLIGTYEAWSIYDRFPKPVKVRVVIGEPLHPEGKSYEDITKELRERVSELVGGAEK
ncbi:AMP-binding protein [Hydrogenivirga sp. 128-5-R1-1]|uniref:AMP-binding protein n=1 Tax=Hydrogenivirga sp. 128-5-R1-1 TaxID=392423 RepID=UPI00015F16C8|nr:AMP-binding protein [Hydrogenivirga sp. 128-5-R1-1]EDP76118.1 long-chain-fatty-acid CoA ligase [Hydrogenivirga sp. 128-5-R1-1]